jgi:hypothetical protein
VTESFQLSGDPSSIRTSAREWQAFADAASSASGSIRTLDTAEFVGDEAQTYQDQISSDLPKHLDTASQAWGIVARALATYAGDLEGFQSTMSALATKASNQQQTVATNQTQVSNAQAADRAHTTLITQVKADLKPGQTLPADTYQSHTSSAQSTLTSAQQLLQSTYDAASRVRSDHADAVRRCRQEIDRAKHLRFAKPPGFWGRLKDSVCGWIKDHAGVLLQISSVLKTISGIAGLIALIPIPGLQEVAAGVALATGGAALLIDVGVKLATGKGSWAQIGIEALSMIPGGKAAMLAGAASTAYTGYEVSQGKASWADLAMTAGMTALSFKGGMREGMGGNGSEPKFGPVEKGPGGPGETRYPVRTDGDGPVVFQLPKKGATQAEIDQMQEYVNVSNEALTAGYLSPTGRVSTAGKLRDDANAAIAVKKAQQEAAGQPFKGVYGHGPDTTWTGKPDAYKWLDQTAKVNSSLGRQALNYPVGYRPTGFHLEIPDGYVPLAE